ncbi:MAG TPA: patatin-like phospholipase family protein [Vicinamibacterales bacterium]|nr:patatin-like phospholipase family protein [Vicinamibacterales bacterium]
MDYLLDVATTLLPQVRDVHGSTEVRNEALVELREAFEQALVAAGRRQADCARVRMSHPESICDNPPRDRAREDEVLAVEVLADLLAREPHRILPALRAVAPGSQAFARVYPTFLEYLVSTIVETSQPPRLRLWKRIAANEYVNLLADRRARVAQILLQTNSWRQVRGAIAQPPTGPSADPGGAAGGGALTASMFGSGEFFAQGGQVRQQVGRAAQYVREQMRERLGEWTRVCELILENSDQTRRFVALLKEELVAAPALVRRLTDATAIAVPFTVALDEELREIRRSRAARMPDGSISSGMEADLLPRADSAAAAAAAAAPQTEGASSAPHGSHALRAAADMDLVGVSLSGGGVRSATFNLGVLQALAHLGLLPRVDYLSTVSGGGYIGAWLVSWSKRAGRHRDAHGVGVIASRLKVEPLAEPDAMPVRAVRFLREYSNYLTPQTGFFSADTWTMVAIWLRNTLLNQAVLLLTLSGLLAVPWMLWLAQFKLANTISSAASLSVLPPCDGGLFASSPVLSTTAAMLLVYASAVTGLQLRRFGVSPAERKQLSQDMLSQMGVLWRVVLPAVVAAALISTALFDALGCLGTTAFPWTPFWELALAFALSAAVVAIGGQYIQCFLADRVSTITRGGRRRLAFVFGLVVIAAAISAAGAAGAWVIVAIGRAITGANLLPADLSFAFVTFGAPLVIAVCSLMVVIKIGILGRHLFDEHREWWSRLGAWLTIVSLGWLAICALSLYAPLLFQTGIRAGYREITASGGIGWALWTAAGVLLGKRDAPTRASGALSESMRRWIVTLAPYVFIGGLLGILSAATFRLLSPIGPAEFGPTDLHTLHGVAETQVWQWMLFGAPLLLLAAFVLSWRVDVNEFSMHHFYKNRLVRCYLGASRDQRPDRPERQPDPFTGFDSSDDLKLAFLRVEPGGDKEIRRAKARDNAQDVFPYIGPLPIINAALNLVRGDDLAWQERKAQSFAFTPCYAGYDYRQRRGWDARHAPYGYRPTSLYGYPPFGIGLGTAVAISGAAASPNMGYQSSPAAGFLMTMFNARLGWWMGNPRDKQNWLRSSPRRGLLYLLNELFGLTNDRTHFVNLSDGGHFENLGIYELVRRRCRYIIACDAEQDQSMTFNGLGNAIRKCRTDFGTEISLRATRVRPADPSSYSPLHCVVGDIAYPNGELGTLLYVKASVTGDEPSDVLEYKSREPAFPHHSTLGDQFFDESQFESYRKLGFHAAHSALASALRSAAREAQEADSPPLLAVLFSHLRDFWHPGNPAADTRRGGHTDRYELLLEQVMQQPSLAFIDDAFFSPVPSDRGQRHEVFVGALMLDLMQRVYLDLDLDEDREHPHNAGWIAIFRRWKEHQAVQTAWAASKTSYSRRFRWFYDTL